MTRTLRNLARLPFGKSLAILLLGCATGSLTCAAADRTQVRPNFVFVLLDDVGFGDLGAYGGEIATPHIDQIARNGVRFTNFHTASTCESSRAMLHSGIDHHRAGAGTLQVVMADNQKGRPGYEGYLSDRAHSLGQLLRDGGYATYFSGKWNLGEGLERAPGTRGWERYLALEQTGADNYEARVYAPFNMEAVWWEDGRRVELPSDFFSTSHYVDKMIQFIEEGKTSRKPFFAALALQAVHSPLQAPDVDIARYADRYAAGWDVIRSQRYQRQVAMGLVPAGLKLSTTAMNRPWSRLGDKEKKLYARKMAVYAGMLDNADQHIGRLRSYLQRIGELGNTVFIVMSDNGADAYELNTLNLPFRLWYAANYKLGIETLGQKGSYVHYGPDWAAVSNTPFSSFKGTAMEGGMRVPFIINYPTRIRPGRIAEQFAYATDFLPTVLDLAGIALPGDDYRGRSLLRPTGRSMLPYLEQRATAIHPASYAVGFEGTGADALFRGDYKISRNAPPGSDNQWHLYNLRLDPTETSDLAASEPALFKELLAEYQTYMERNGVIKPTADYDPLRQLLKNNWRVLVRQLAGVLALTLGTTIVIVAALAYGLRRWRRRRLA